MLWQFVSKNNFKLVISIKTPQKLSQIRHFQKCISFTDWKNQMTYHYQYFHFSLAVRMKYRNHSMFARILLLARTAGMTEVKNEDFYKSIALNTVQLKSALTNYKHKASKMEEESVFTGKTFGIIIDAKEWYFMKCSLDDQNRLRFKLSELVVIVYKDENMKNM
ncbi:2259_t:CDS:2 [Funneliformis caledonium]|uniref:2259_t:CDS:1 n=1 Tax=Funneliformis caledonium TaxID=1117310 RepID=A0A9N8VF38_9GLOM|nr:2259_t:CDS:2 [Funneliformis caledonium]